MPEVTNLSSILLCLLFWLWALLSIFPHLCVSPPLEVLSFTVVIWHLCWCGNRVWRESYDVRPKINILYCLTFETWCYSHATLNMSISSEMFWTSAQDLRTRTSPHCAPVDKGRLPNSCFYHKDETWYLVIWVGFSSLPLHKIRQASDILLQELGSPHPLYTTKPAFYHP